jgi:NADPH:quinone reductase-like Zn-dependent oxidoreductase
LRRAVGSIIFETEVIGVSSTVLELVRSLGADRVDYTHEDFTRNDETYDVVFDAVGKLLESQGKRALKPTGIYLNVHKASGNGEKLEELLAVKEIIEAGQFKPA